jgi:hypothetical protein
MTVDPANARGPRPRPEQGVNRADEDAAALAVVLALVTAQPAPEPEPVRTVWGDAAHRLRVAAPGRHGWWASGLPS